MPCKKLLTIDAGGKPYPASRAEYFFSILPNNTPIKWSRAKSLFSLSHYTISQKEFPESGEGIFKYCWFYDGVVAEIEIGHTTYKLFIDFYPKIKVKRLRNTRNLQGEGLNGDGI